MARKKTKKNRYKKGGAAKWALTPVFLRRALWGAGFTVSVVLFGVLAILIHDVFTQSPYFEASSIEIQGLERLSHEAALAQAGVKPGINILSVSLKNVQDSLVAHPWIAKARVRRDLPGKLTITVTERRAMAVLDLGELFLMDTRGEIFKRCQGEESSGLPLITGLKFSDIGISGEHMSEPYENVVQFLQARKDNDWALPASVISRIHVDRDIGLTLISRDPEMHVRLGYGGYAEKLMRLNYVLFKCSESKGVKAALIDIVDVNRVVVRPREEV